jgi:DivIVA domain-containing protein
VALVAVVLLGIAALTALAVLLGLTDSPLSEEPVDRIDDGLPARTLTAHDVSGLRFRVGLRGYRMDDVDRALDRLRDSLHEAEERAAAAEHAAAVAGAKPRPVRARRSAKSAEPSADGT